MLAYQARRYEVITDLKAVDVPLQPVAKPPLNLAEQFPESFPLQVAIYLTREDEGGLGLVHAFQEMGIPFFVTREFDRAVAHSCLFIYPEIDGNSFTPAQAQKLTEFVQSGGTVFAQNVFTGGFRPLFGFRNFRASHSRHRLSIVAEGHPLFKYLDRPEEREVPLADSTVASLFATNGYTSDGSSQVLAQFKDGSAALLGKATGQGSAFVTGVAFDDVILRSQCNRHYRPYRAYVNTFEPGGDVWLLMLRAWYEHYQPGFVRLATIPEGKRSWLMLSHDVDWENSVVPMLDFAEMEARHHTKSTFFMQAKYISDMNGRAFFYGSNLTVLSQLVAKGFDVESHTVVHARGFNQFEWGTGGENYSNYRPRMEKTGLAEGGSVLGEVRVSKELIDAAVPGHQTVFFRAGHLRFPPTLAQALAECGYEFDSSFTAPDVMSNFPYQLTYDKDFEHESPIYEFPVTIEDEAEPPLAERVGKALEVIQANANNGAVSVILIHTNDPKTKVPAEDQLLTQLPADIGVSDMLSFARYWRARDRLVWTIVQGKDSHEVTLTAQTSEPASGLTFSFGQDISSVDGGANLLPDHRHIVLPALAVGQEARFNIVYQSAGR